MATVNIGDRPIINARERPLSSDINDLISAANTTAFGLSYFHNAQSVGAAISSTYPELGGLYHGFFGTGFRCVAGTGMQVTLLSGVGLVNTYLYAGGLATNIDSVQGLNNYQLVSPVILANNLNITVPAAPSSPNNRIDIIEIKADYDLTDVQSRDVFDTATETFVGTSVNKLFTWLLNSSDVSTVSAPSSSTGAIGYKVGVAASSPSAPSVTSGYIKIAEIRVNNGTVAVTNLMVADVRRILSPSGFMFAQAYCQVNAAGFTALTGSNKHQTPGIRHFTYYVPATETVMWVWFPGAAVDSAQCFANAEYIRATYTADNHIYLMTPFAPAVGTVTASGLIQTEATAAGIDVGPGTPYIAFGFGLRHQASGTTNRTPETDPYEIRLFGSIRQTIA
jgi:hypothetical protein